MDSSTMPMRYALTMLMNKYVPDNDVAIKLTHRCLMNELMSLKRFNSGTGIFARMGNQAEWWEHPYYTLSSYYWEGSGIQTRSSLSGLIYSCDVSCSNMPIDNVWVSVMDTENYTKVRNNLILTINRDTNAGNYDFHNGRYFYACNNWEGHIADIARFLKCGHYWDTLQDHMIDKLALTPELLRSINRPYLLKYMK
tara:strand:- start:42 stop:629 length:588 start_codon:yes stop_codon:yes gene_type:complete